jgi:hypothetical protein
MTKSDLALPKKVSKAFKFNGTNDINGDIRQLSDVRSHNCDTKSHN